MSAPRVSLEEVAAAAQVSGQIVINHFPPEFAVPRDWALQGARVMLGVDAVRRLAVAFDEEQRVDVGNRLRDLAEQRAPRVAREVVAS